MNLQQQQKKKLKMSLKLFFLVIILIPLMFAATYTWFSISRTPKVSEMGIVVDSGTGLELAFTGDAPDEEWTQHLDFRDQSEEASILKPVTWSEKEQCFYAADFGADGRIAGITYRLTDEANTNNTGSNSYYMKKTCYARTGVPVIVSLSPAVVGGDGTQGAGTYLIGTPVWNSDRVGHDNGGHGAEYAVRVGIRITKFDAETETRLGDSVFYIYEPNSDGHVSGDQVTVNTPSIDGTDTLVPAERMILQTTSSWNETYPIQRDVVIRQLGEFTTDTELFELAETEIAQIEFYVWLEGQDVDCTNQIGLEAQIFANIQFQAENDGQQSGMEPIY